MSENEKVDVDALRHEHDGSMRGQMIANAAADELVRLRAENAEIAKEANRMNSEINRLRKVEEAAKACSIHIVTVPGSISEDCIAKLDAALAETQDKPKEPCATCGGSKWVPSTIVTDKPCPLCNPGAKESK